jgi:endoglucanase
MRASFVLVGALAASAGGSAAKGSRSAVSVNAPQMLADMGFGANISNTLDNTASWETGGGEPLISQAYIDGMANSGIKTVRVPVAWDTYASNGVIDAMKMNRVKQILGWIEAAGMYAVVNIHWDGGWIDNVTVDNPHRFLLTDDVRAKFASYWAQIAQALSALGPKLIFEALSEESQFYVSGDTSRPDYAALNALNQLFVTTVRAQPGYNKTRALSIAGFTADITLTCVDAFEVPHDPAGPNRLFLSVHFYTPFAFCGLDKLANWDSARATWGDDADESELTRLFDRLEVFSSQRDIPVILGEFGTPGRNPAREPASRARWLAATANAAFARGIVPILWDTGSDISRTDGSFSPEFRGVWDVLYRSRKK